MFGHHFLINLQLVYMNLSFFKVFISLAIQSGHILVRYRDLLCDIVKETAFKHIYSLSLKQAQISPKLALCRGNLKCL